MLIGNALFVVAIAHVPLATASAIGFTAPLIVTALAGPLLREHVGVRRWSAVLVGFAGALVIIRPGSGFADPMLLLLLLGVGAHALYLIATRWIGHYDSPATSIVFSALMGSLSMTLVLPFSFVWPRDAFDFAMLCSLGLIGAAGHYLVIRAFRHGPAAVIAPLSYVELIGTAMLGYLVFDNFPDCWIWVGAAIIIASGHLHRIARAPPARRRPLTPRQFDRKPWLPPIRAGRFVGWRSEPAASGRRRATRPRRRPPWPPSPCREGCGTGSARCAATVVGRRAAAGSFSSSSRSASSSRAGRTAAGVAGCLSIVGVELGRRRASSTAFACRPWACASMPPLPAAGPRPDWPNTCPSPRAACRCSASSLAISVCAPAGSPVWALPSARANEIIASAQGNVSSGKPIAGAARPPPPLPVAPLERVADRDRRDGVGGRQVGGGDLADSRVSSSSTCFRLCVLRPSADRRRP